MTTRLPGGPGRPKSAHLIEVRARADHGQPVWGAWESGFGYRGVVQDGSGALLEASWTPEAIKVTLGPHFLTIRASKTTLQDFKNQGKPFKKQQFSWFCDFLSEMPSGSHSDVSFMGLRLQGGGAA